MSMCCACVRGDEHAHGHGHGHGHMRGVCAFSGYSNPLSAVEVSVSFSSAPQARKILAFALLIRRSSVGLGGLAIFGFVELMNLSDLRMK